MNKRNPGLTKIGHAFIKELFIKNGNLKHNTINYFGYVDFWSEILLILDTLDLSKKTHLYQRAYEYVQLQQGEDIKFNDDISNIRETSRKKFNNLIAFNSKFKRESNLGDSELNRQSSEILVDGFKEHIQAHYIR